jgi:hypothetical protein
MAALGLADDLREQATSRTTDRPYSAPSVANMLGDKINLNRS